MRRRDILQQLPFAILISLSPEQLWHVAYRARNHQSSLTFSETDLLSAIVDRFLPVTDSSPSASEVGVPAFIEISLNELVSPADRQLFYTGLQDLSGEIASRFGKSFSSLTQKAQDLFLREKMETRDDFCIQLKKLAMTAYFSSEQGMTTALDYNPIPGKFDPCIDVTPATKAEAVYF